MFYFTEHVLECLTCKFQEKSGSGVYDGDLNCLSGDGVTPKPCHGFPSSGQERRCIAYEFLQDLDDSGKIYKEK